MGYNQKLVFFFSATILRNSLLDLLSALLENILGSPLWFCGHFGLSEQYYFQV